MQFDDPVEFYLACGLAFWGGCLAEKLEIRQLSGKGK